MKKLGFIVMPLMAVSLLASCGGGDDPGPTPSPTVVHNLVYVYDNDTENTFTEKYIDDEKTKEPTWTPTFKDHTFEGWYMNQQQENKEEDEEFTFGKALTGKTTTIYAHWSPESAPVVHNLVYNFDNGTGKTYTETYVGDDETKEPTWTPSYDDRTFEGWYYNEQYTPPDSPFTFGDSLEGEVTNIHAHWSFTPVPVVHELVYHFDNPAATEETYTETYIDDKETVKPTWTPTFKNHTFKGWYVNKQGSGAEDKEFEFGHSLSSITTPIYAHWDDPTTYTITFNANGGNLDAGADESIDKIGSGTEWKNITGIDKQTATKANHNFAGWGLSPNTPDVIDGEYTITKSFTVYAVYTPYATATIKLTDDSRNCKLRYGGTPHDIGVLFTVPAGVDVPIIVEPNDNCLPVFKENLAFIGTGSSTGAFDYIKGKIIVNLDANSTGTIKATTIPPRENLDAYPWSEISQLSEMGLADKYFDIYDPEKPELNCKRVQLQHQDTAGDGADVISDGELYQTVRIIGFNEDYTKLPTDGSDPDPSKAIGITFEFADLISDTYGYSLATYWEDTSDDNTANHDYKNSSIHKALTKGGGGDLHWFEKEGVEFSTDSKYADTSVLDMLPNELKEEGILKTTAKYINIYNSELATPAWEEQTVEDKLFLLSPVEMGKASHEHEEPSTTTYTYYKGADDNDRIKHQIKGLDGAIPNRIEVSSGKYVGSKSSYAGVNNKITPNYGCYLWLRSPRTNESDRAKSVDASGEVVDNYTNVYAMPIAPAFCI
ncbi:MAG: InlB B-repeat-containing protein [Bacilli bacterium]|nr:InlB B-repeat-containing protein [Bacilli bacterium]